MTETRRVSTIVDLVALVDLTGVRTFEFSGRLLDAPADAEIEERQDIQVHLRASPGDLQVRVRLTIQTDEAELVADCAAVFELKESDPNEQIEIDDDVKREFVERVGIMAVYPFLRESIFATAVRLQVAAPVLGLLKAGQFSMTPNPQTSTDFAE